MNVKSVIAAMAIMSASLTACESGEKSTDSQRPAQSNVAQWAPSLAPDDVMALSPDEAKAILLARSVVEKNAKLAGQPAPEISHFYPTATADGWDVHVEYVAFWNNGKPFPGPGFFTVVRIRRNWKVVQVIGGA